MDKVRKNFLESIQGKKMRESSALPRRFLRRFCCKLPRDGVLPPLNYKRVLFKFESVYGAFRARVTPAVSADIPLVLRAPCMNWLRILRGYHSVSLKH